MHIQSIKHCKNCGFSVRYRIPDDGDTRERAVCPSCNTIHYENPLNVVGTIPYWNDQVLLCKRNISPRRGLWTLPAGFMELGETTAEGAARETIEEAGANFELENLFSIVNVRRVGQVHLFYVAKLLNTEFAPGPETMEVQLFNLKDIPWTELAFSTVRCTLERFIADRETGIQQFHTLDVS